MSRARAARRAAEREQRKATRYTSDATSPALELGFRAIQAYAERVPTLPDDLGAHVVMSFETEIAGAMRVALLPRDVAITLAIMERRFDLAAKLVRAPLDGGLTLIATTTAGDFAIRVGEVLTSAAGRPITAPGGVA